MLSAGYENKTVYVQYQDGAGNVSAAASDSIDYQDTVVSISVSPDVWDIGPRELSAVVESGTYAVANEGNVPVDVSVRATNGANGWTLAAAPAHNAFQIEVDINDTGVYDLVLNTGEQSFVEDIAVSGTVDVGLRYSAPTGDTFGADSAQDFAVVFKATVGVP